MLLPIAAYRPASPLRIVTRTQGNMALVSSAIDVISFTSTDTDIDVSYLSFLFQGKEQPVHDVVFAVHSLSELTGEAERETTVESLWRSVAPGGYLAIVEPGTPFGYVTLARQFHGMSRSGNTKSCKQPSAPFSRCCLCQFPCGCICTTAIAIS